MADLSLPNGAELTQDHDLVLMTAWPSYRGQLVRLAACEKGVKWKHFLVDIHSALTQFEPWYINLNPKAYVPTMLVHPNNTPVCESAEIVTRIENDFEGTTSLSPQNEEQ